MTRAKHALSDVEGTRRQIPNSKSEIRNKFKCSKAENSKRARFGSRRRFRYSDFGFSFAGFLSSQLRTCLARETLLKSFCSRFKKEGGSTLISIRAFRLSAIDFLAGFRQTEPATLLVPPGNFLMAAVRMNNSSANQPAPVRPKKY